MESRINLHKVALWLLPLIGVAFFVLLNLSVSKMTPAGIAINLLAIYLLALYLIKPATATLVAFFALNAMLGPFLFVNLHEIGLPTLGRLDFFLAILIGLALLLRNERISRGALALCCAYIALLAWGFAMCLKLGDPLIPFLDNWYSVAGRLAVGVVLFRLVEMRGTPRVTRMAALLLLVALVAHLAISWLQLLVPISLRAGTLEAAFRLHGFNLNRPVGLYEASYVYGVSTIGFWWLWRRLAGTDFPRLSRFLLLAAIPVAMISTRSVGLGILLYIGLTYWGSTRALWRILISLMVFVAAATMEFQLIALVTFLDQSNSTKILLAWTTLATWSSDFPSIRSFLGYGYDQAGILAAGSGFFELAESLGAAYDNRIDEGNGFPIHNVFIQFFFEYGLLASIACAWLLWRGLRNIINHRIEPATTFFWCVAVTHFTAHNGIFSPWLTLALLLTAFPSSAGTSTPANISAPSILRVREVA